MPEHEFQELVERARGVQMTAREREQQRRSFAYGNANIENEAVTRAVIDKAAEELERERRERSTRA